MVYPTVLVERCVLSEHSQEQLKTITCELTVHPRRRFNFEYRLTS